MVALILRVLVAKRLLVVALSAKRLIKFVDVAKRESKFPTTLVRVLIKAEVRVAPVALKLVVEAFNTFKFVVDAVTASKTLLVKLVMNPFVNVSPEPERLVVEADVANNELIVASEIVVVARFVIPVTLNDPRIY